ncbi:LuxR C-terminal-related transcriptional regulator [Actinoplanes sp. NPDC049681]|uniref:helix-turn-helix transcriptional regulator n=1 Tax=Actinoplanes sp. NPDC049681 TaxID=3363905 RepID=UPI0037A0369C
METPAGGPAVVAVAQIAVMPGSVGQRAHALLEPLRRLVPYDAAWISLLDPERRILPPLVREGYDARVQQYLDGPQLMDDIELVGMHRHRPPMRLKDLPVPPSEVVGWADYLRPAGFGEGISVPLTTSDGRYLGLFCCNTAACTAPSDAVRDEFATLAPLIAHAVDPLRSIRAVADIVTGAVAGVVLTRAGNTVALPGLPGDPLLAPGSSVVEAARTVLDPSGVQALFLAPRDDTAGAALIRVTAMNCPPQPPGHLRATVLLSPPPDLRGLTRRELRILGLLIAGWPHARIAATLIISMGAVAGHIAHIMVKLDARSATVAAVRALRQGLYLPAALTAPTASGGHR